MATLTGQPIDQSYSGLLKTEDNGVIGAVAKGITDGVGGVTNMTIATTATNFVSGTVDFTGATVSGLPSGGAAGLESGTATDSMQSAASLTTVASAATGAQSIALGNGATTDIVEGIAIGNGASTGASSTSSIVIGASANGTTAADTIYIGNNIPSLPYNGDKIIIGHDPTAAGRKNVQIGNDTQTSNDFSVVLGHEAKALQGRTVTIGYQAQTGNGFGAIAIGDNASTTTGFAAAVALGQGVVAGIADTVSIKALEVQTDSTPTAGGIIISDAGGTDRRINIDAAGGLQIDSTAVGGAGLESGTGADSMQSAASLTTTAADAAGAETVALGQSAQAGGANTISIGSAIASTSSSQNSVNIGKNLTSNNASTDGTVNIGNGNVTNSGRTVAIGYDVDITSGQGQAIGNDIDMAGADRSTAIGSGIVIDSTGSDKIGIGTTMTLSSDRAIGIGRDVIVSGLEAIAIGGSTNATATNSVALGEGVTAATADTVSVKALETQTNSTPTAGGIIMSDAAGTDRRLNIDATGNLQVDSTPVHGTVFTLPRVGGLVQSSGCDVIQSSVLIPGGTMQAGDMWQLNGADSATGSTGFVYSAYWISTSGTIGGAATEEMNLGQQESQNASWSLGYQKTLYIGTQDGTGIGTEIVCSGCPSDVNGDFQSAMVTDTPDWTNDLYLVTRICVDNAGATYINHGATLRKIN